MKNLDWKERTLLLSRWLVTVLGSLINVTSGIAAYPWRWFIFWDVLGEVTWVVLYVTLGYVFSDRVQALGQVLGDFAGAILAIVLMLILGWQVLRTVRPASPRTGSACGAAVVLGLLVWLAGLASAAPTAPTGDPAAPLVDDSALGLTLVANPASPSLEQDLADIRQLGFHWVRIQPDWVQIQPEAGRFDWTLSDRLVAGARRQGLSILYTLGNTPRWASTYAAQADPDVWMRNPPRSMSDWQSFVSAVTRRYRHQVAYWQLWERLDIHYYRGWGPEMVDMLGILAGATHARRVVLPEPSPIRLGVLQAFCHPRTVDRFEIVGLAPHFATPEQMLRPLGVLQTRILGKRPPPKKIWISSLGWNTQPVPGPLQEPVVSETEQACYLVRGMVLALSHGVGRVFWKTWRDSIDGPYQAQSRSGLIRADGSPRPALQACRTLLSQLQGRRFAKAAAWGPHLHGYLFDGDRGSLLVAWSDRESSALPVPAEMVATVTDLQGRQAPAGRRLDLTAHPLLVEGSAADLRSLLAASPAPRPAPDPDFSTATEVTAVLGRKPRERGLYLQRYQPIETRAVTVIEREGVEGWSTRIALKKTEILVDVDDTFLYFVDGRWNVEVDVEVYAARAPGRAGFNLGYDYTRGYGFTSWQWIEAGRGWKKYTFRIADASFSDPVADFRINVLGSKEDLLVRSVTVRKQPRD